MLTGHKANLMWNKFVKYVFFNRSRDGGKPKLLNHLFINQISKVIQLSRLCCICIFLVLVGLRKVLVSSQCLIYIKEQSERCQPGEPAEEFWREAKLTATYNRGTEEHRRAHLHHLKQFRPQNFCHNFLNKKFKCSSMSSYAEWLVNVSCILTVLRVLQQASQTCWIAFCWEVCLQHFRDWCLCFSRY